jgi:hypothetical protein
MASISVRRVGFLDLTQQVPAPALHSLRLSVGHICNVFMLAMWALKEADNILMNLSGSLFDLKLLMAEIAFDLHG